jgi:cytochrome c553
MPGRLLNQALLAALIAAVGVSACFAAGTSQDVATPLGYNRDVRPILAEACFSCHGPDSAARQADLRLDQRDAAIEHGVLVPGDPAGSELLRRILSDDPDEQMPPPETKKTITPEQRAILERWILAGAAYEPHWSLIAPHRPAPPEVKDAAWVRNPIDRFILAELERRGWSPAPEADLRTLARRVSLDLTGLPPTPEELALVLSDTGPDAYERYVDRLLASPRWGEHRTRYWLDVARYADTHGIHFDNYRENWAYRDWIIKAFNRNLPFDEFTVENLAGDLLPGATLDDRVASGFNRCHITTNEGGAINEEYLVLYARDRTETTARAWLGLTAGCAVCHDHKFDPLSQREFYSLAAFFNNTTQAAMDGNIKDTPPIEVVPRPEDAPRWAALQKLVPEAQAAVDQRREKLKTEFQTWLDGLQPRTLEDRTPTAGLQLHVPLDDGGATIAYTQAGRDLQAKTPGTVEWRSGRLRPQAAYLNGGAVLESPETGDFDSDEAFTVAAWIKLPGNDTGGAIVARMDDQQDFRGWDFWLQGSRIGMHLIHRWQEDAVKVIASDPLPPDVWTHVAVTYDGSKKAAGVSLYVNGEQQKTLPEVDQLKGTIRTDKPFKIGQRHYGNPLTSGAQLQDVRVYDRALDAAEAFSLANSSLLSAVVAQRPDQRAADEVERLYRWWMQTVDPESIRLTTSLAALQKEQDDVRLRGTVAYVMNERSEQPEAFVLNRGEYDQRGERVTPSTPAMLPPMADDLPRNRLGLARWIVAPENPLTARVQVNRFWSEVFGAGLVKTAGDFGVTGQLPSHPELLDWLAVDFRESHWDVKRLFKLLVTSATYRQSAAAPAEKWAADPENRYLARGPRFRMDAETLRDAALAASGLLSPKIGGASVKPYQPPGVWEAVAMIGSNTRDYQQDAGESLYRRSMYTFWKRAAPPASMEILNAPTRETCVMLRERTNTPLQALVTLNDPQFVEAARRLAEVAIKAEHEEPRRCQFMAERILSRPLRPEELALALDSVARLRQRFDADADAAKKLVAYGDSQPDDALDPRLVAAWTLAASELMNLDEAITK